MDAARYSRVADDVELLALVRRETGKVRVGQGRVDDARVAFAEAREGLLAAGLEHEAIDVEAGLAECAALEGDLSGAIGDHAGGDRHRDQDRARDRARRSALPPRVPAAAAGAVPRRRARSSSAGWTHPTRARVAASGRSTCSAAASRARAPGARTRRTSTPPLATLRELGVEVLPHGLGHWGGVKTAQHGRPSCPVEEDLEQQVSGVVTVARDVVGAEVSPAFRTPFDGASRGVGERSGVAQRDPRRVARDSLAGALGLVAAQDEGGRGCRCS